MHLAGTNQQQTYAHAMPAASSVAYIYLSFGNKQSCSTSLETQRILYKGQVKPFD